MLTCSSSEFNSGSLYSSHHLPRITPSLGCASFQPCGGGSLKAVGTGAEGRWYFGPIAQAVESSKRPQAIVGQIGNLTPIENRPFAGSGKLQDARTGRLGIGGRLPTCPTMRFMTPPTPMALAPDACGPARHRASVANGRNRDTPPEWCTASGSGSQS